MWHILIGHFNKKKIYSKIKSSKSQKFQIENVDFEVRECEFEMRVHFELITTQIH